MNISVICPVYGAEITIGRCVDSILLQSFTDFELILVDDGSPDRSGLMCDGYAERDPRVKVIHKENGGVSSARQAGMDVAAGEYFIHADPDDWVDPDWLEKMYSTAQSTGADVVVCDIMYVDDGKKTLSRQCHPSYSQKRIAKSVTGGKMAPSLCNKLIRRSVYDKYGIRFPSGINAGEDIFVCHSMFIKGVKCAFCEGVYYYYDRFGGKTVDFEALARKRMKDNIACVGELEKVSGDGSLRRRSVRMMKYLVKMKAFYVCPSKEFIWIFREINPGYVLRNWYKVTKVEGYAALALVIRNSKAAMSLFRFLKSRF